MSEPKISVSLSERDVALILQALGQRPWVEVNDIIGRIAEAASDAMARRAAPADSAAPEGGAQPA